MHGVRFSELCNDDAAGAAASGGPSSDQAAVGTGDPAPTTETAAVDSFSTTNPASGTAPIRLEHTAWQPFCPGTSTPS